MKVQVEAKAYPQATRSWAKRFWLDLVEMGRRPAAAVFVLVTPAQLYIWKTSKVKSGMPTHTIETQDFLEPYFTRAEILPTEINPAAFEMLVSWWLNDLASQRYNKQGHVSLAWKELLKTMADGEVVREARA